MRSLRTATFLTGAVAAAALLAACNGSNASQSFAPSGSGASSSLSVHHSFMLDKKFPGYTGLIAPNIRVRHDKQWISKDMAGLPRLLFTTDYGSGEVYVYSLPKMTLKATLTGFSGPQGACTDGSNIWITNTNTSQIFKYSRAGTLVNTLSDPGQFPVGCSVNRSNGDVAVSNIINTADTGGNVIVYAGGTGSGTTLTNSAQLEYFFPAYDKSGNLYVDGFSTSGSFILSECASGAGSCTTMNVSGASPTFPGGLNWDAVNSQLVIGDQECSSGSCQYQATVTGSTAMVTNTVALLSPSGGTCDVDQGALAPFSKYFAGGCSGASTGSFSARWAFPAGGEPTSSAGGLVEPLGAAISNK